MHVGVMSILQLHCLASIQHTKMSPLLINVRLARSALREQKRLALTEQERQGHVMNKKRRLQGKQLDPAATSSAGMNFL